MPVIARFYGITIQMVFTEDNPPHFYLTYGEFKAKMDIINGVFEGIMRKRALKFVFEWMELHKDELLENWKLIENGKAPKLIEPLE